MANPWLSVPLQDYEAHMSSPDVAQLNVLSDLFAVALDRCRPCSVAVLGVAGGNGLSCVDTTITKRVAGVDVNPAYLDAVRRRYPNLPGLQLHCVDLAAQGVALDPVALVHAALVFEHAGTGKCLENAVSLVAPGGALSIVLQLPSESEQGVSATGFASIQNLAGQFKLIDPAWLVEELKQRSFRLDHQTRRELPRGKAFWMGLFSRSA